MKSTCFLAGLVLAVTVGIAAPAPANAIQIIEVTGTAAQADSFDAMIEARWRNLDGSRDSHQMYLGQDGMGNGGKRVQTKAGFLGSTSDSYDFSLSWDLATLTATQTVSRGSQSATHVAVYDGNGKFSRAEAFNDIKFFYNARSIDVGGVATPRLQFTAFDIAIDGGTKQAITGLTNDVNFNEFRIYDLAYSNSFTLSGSFVTPHGVPGSQEAVKFDFKLGNIPGTGGFSPTSTPIPEPATWAMMLLGFAIAGLRLRKTRSA